MIVRSFRNAMYGIEDDAIFEKNGKNVDEADDEVDVENIHPDIQMKGKKIRSCLKFQILT